MNVFQYEVLGGDTETTGLVYPRDKAFSVSLAPPEGEPLFIDLRTEQHLIPAFQRDLDRYPGRIVFHNAAFDVRMLASAGINVPLHKVDCTVVRACLINEHEDTLFPWGRPGSYALEDLCQKYLGIGKDEPYAELAAIFGGKPTRNAQITNLQHAPRELVQRYQNRDASLALVLWLWQEREIASQDLHQIVAFERSRMPTFIRAMLRGIRVDKGCAEESVWRLDKVIAGRQRELEHAIGINGFNVNSSSQVKNLFDPVQRTEDGVWVSRRTGAELGTTKSGGPSLTAGVLDAMTDPIAESISEIRSLIKTRDTFLSGHVLGHMVGERVYPTINQTAGEDGGARSGRLSYQKPAMHQIPSRNKEVAAIIKPCFLPEHGQKWASTDMNSFEVRVFAHLVALYNTALQEIYAKNPEMDFHQYVADLMGIPRNAPKSGAQRNAKQINLSMIFNQGKGTTAYKLGLDWEWAQFKVKGSDEVVKYRKVGPEADALISEYHRNVPGVKTLADRAKAIAEARGYIQTSMGRRLRFPRKYKSYKASGLLIQATSADYNKHMWVDVEEELGNNGTIILNTHDSFDMSVDPNWEPIIKRVREIPLSYNSRVPLLMDLNGVGNNWWEALNNAG